MKVRRAGGKIELSTEAPMSCIYSNLDYDPFTEIYYDLFPATSTDPLMKRIQMQEMVSEVRIALNEWYYQEAEKKDQG